MADVFISYCHKERDRVLPLAEKLKALALDVWFDAKLHTGSDFSEEIGAELESAKAIVVCWSAASTQSKWVKSEAQIGLDQDTIVPCFIEHCVLKPPFTVIQAEDLSDWQERWEHVGFQKLVTRLGVLVGRPGLASLCAAHSDPTGRKLASWASNYPDDPATGVIWEIWEQRQRNEFKAETDRVRQSLAKELKTRQSRFDSRLISVEQEFESWIGRKAGIVGHNRPDPKSILPLITEETTGQARKSTSPDRTHPPTKTPASPYLAAALLVGALAGVGLTWFALRSSAFATSGPVEQRIKVIEADLDRASSEKAALQGEVAKTRDALSFAKKQAADLREALEDSTSQRSDVAAVRKVFESRLAEASTQAASAQEARQAAERSLDQTKEERDRAQQASVTASSRADGLSVQLAQAQARIAQLEKTPTVGSSLQDRAYSAVVTYYKLHSFERGDSLDGAIEIYPSRFKHFGNEVTKDWLLDDLRRYNRSLSSVRATPTNQNLDYRECTRQDSCLVRGSVQFASKRTDRDDFKFSNKFFALRFNLDGPIKVLDECVASQQSKCD